MAEEVLYAAAGNESNKRKYEEAPPPAARRATGFSAPPDSAGPLPTYTSVPPPLNEIELAKQKAQEIAARLLNNADPLKKARVDGDGGGFDSSNQKPLAMGVGGSPLVASSGYSGPTKKIEIPNSRVGVIIGKGGETIKYLQLQSGAKIQVTRDMDADPNSATRGVELTGTPDQIAKAEQLINDVLSEAETGGSGIVSQRLTRQPYGAEQFVMKVPNNKVGLVIGKGGETIKNMQARSGARIQVIPLHLPPGDASKERTVQIDGTSEQIEIAKHLVEEVTSENRVRNPSMSGGYPQQGCQSQPPTNWAQPGPPMQQPGYGYSQAGAYPGPSAQYNVNPTPYSGYPQSVSGGYSTGWDQSTAQQNQQGGGQGSSYDYYNQQQPPQQQSHGGPGVQPDGFGYGYGQETGYSQGQGYGQGYSSAFGNGSTIPTPDGHTSSHGTQGGANQTPVPGQSYNAGGQAYSNSYPPQASTQPGYGVHPSSEAGHETPNPTSYGPPQTQKPQPAYAQPQQSPSVQGSGYTQPGYPHSQPSPGQPAYNQSDAGAQRPPASGYPTSQPYGYGQQPPMYNSSYSGGYSQPPAYASDGSTGGNAHGTYDAASQSVQPSGAAAKASPPS